MFEKSAGKEEKDRSRVIMVVSGAAVLAVIVLVIVVTQFVKPATPVDMERVHPVAEQETEEMGVAMLCPPQNVPQNEAQAYVPSLVFNIQKKMGEYPNLNSKYARIHGSLKNTGDRAIEGLQLRMVLFGHNCEVIKEKIATIIPEKKGVLAPGESVAIDMSIDKTPSASEIMHMRIEPYALKVK